MKSPKERPLLRRAAQGAAFSWMRSALSQQLHYREWVAKEVQFLPMVQIFPCRRRLRRRWWSSESEPSRARLPSACAGSTGGELDLNIAASMARSAAEARSAAVGK